MLYIKQLHIDSWVYLTSKVKHGASVMILCADIKLQNVILCLKCKTFVLYFQTWVNLTTTCFISLLCKYLKIKLYLKMLFILLKKYYNKYWASFHMLNFISFHNNFVWTLRGCLQCVMWCADIKKWPLQGWGWQCCSNVSVAF